MLNQIKNKIKKISKRTPLIVVSFLCVVTFNFAYSSTLDNVAGYGWSADWVDLNSNGTQNLPNETTGGVGFISFNCVTDQTCGDLNLGNYGVKIDPITKDVTGYAWSSNYGWVKFGGLANFPTGSGTTPINAKFTGTVLNGNFNGNLSGWARFCSVAANPDSCLGFVNNDQNGGWDGWISLSGATPNYGITITNNIMSGYAWGGDDNNKNVVGWVDFSGVSLGDNQVYLDFYASPSPVFAPNNTTELRWNALNGVTFTSCTADSTTVNPTHPNPSVVTGWSGSKSAITPAVFTVNLLEGSYNPTNYKITCIDTVGTSHTSTIAVPKITEESLTLRNDRVITTGGVSSTVLRWTAVNVTPNSCVASTVNPNTGLNWTITNPKIPPTTGSPSPASGIMTDVVVTAVLPNKTSYVLTCTGLFSGETISTSLDIHTTSGASSVRKIPVYQEN